MEGTNFQHAKKALVGYLRQAQMANPAVDSRASVMLFSEEQRLVFEEAKLRIEAENKSKERELAREKELSEMRLKVQ
jgi:hypothetical protein